MRAKDTYREVRELLHVLTFAKLLEQGRKLRNLGINERERRWCLFYFTLGAELYCYPEITK